MRLFGILSDGKFSEYVQTPFQVDHEEAVLDDGLESNPDEITAFSVTVSNFIDDMEI